MLFEKIPALLYYIKKNINIKKNSVIILLLIIIISIFSINNFIKYSYEWGYDANSHMSMIQYIDSNNNLPAEGYAASNPPLYYIFAAFIFKISKSMKIVQLFSLILYFIICFLLYKLVTIFSKNTFLNLSIIALFSALPPALNFAYMILDYSLGNFLSMLTLFVIFIFVIRKKMDFKSVVVLSILVSLGILTTLTNLAVFLTTLVILIFFPNVKYTKKIVQISVFIFLTTLIIMPYYLYKSNKYGDFFSAPNKAQTKKVITEVYPLEFYYKFNLKDFDKPYATNNVYDGLWIILHQTLYSDYWNYLVSEKCSFNTLDKEGLIGTFPIILMEVK